MPTASRLLIALLALLLAGCSLTPEEPEETSERRPLQVQHARGDRRVPFLSERPATLDPAALEAAIALGIKPVGSTSWRRDGRQPAYLRPLTTGVRWLGYAPRPNVPLVRRLQPDVIIGNNLFQKRVFKRLDAIAPTVYSGIPLSEWEGDLRFFGESLGRSDEGERLLIDYDKRVGRVRRALAGGKPKRVELGPELSGALQQGFVDSVLDDVGLPAGTARASGQGGGIIAARLVLDRIERAAQRG